MAYGQGPSCLGVPDFERVASSCSGAAKPIDRQRLSLGADGRYGIAPPGLGPGLC